MLIYYHKPLMPMVEWSNYTWLVTIIDGKIFALFPVSTNVIFMKLYHYLRHTGGSLGNANFVKEICQFLKCYISSLILVACSNVRPFFGCSSWWIYSLQYSCDIHTYKQIYIAIKTHYLHKKVWKVYLASLLMMQPNKNKFIDYKTYTIILTWPGLLLWSFCNRLTG